MARAGRVLYPYHPHSIAILIAHSSALIRTAHASDVLVSEGEGEGPRLATITAATARMINTTLPQYTNNTKRDPNNAGFHTAKSGGVSRPSPSGVSRRGLVCYQALRLKVRFANSAPTSLAILFNYRPCSNLNRPRAKQHAKTVFPTLALGSRAISTLSAIVSLSWAEGHTRCLTGIRRIGMSLIQPRSCQVHVWWGRVG